MYCLERPSLWEKKSVVGLEKATLRTFEVQLLNAKYKGIKEFELDLVSQEDGI